MLSFSMPRWLSIVRQSLPRAHRHFIRGRINSPFELLERLEERRLLTVGLDFPGQVAAEYTTVTPPVAVAVADIDHDGAVDVITANAQTGVVSILRNHGD